MAGAIMTLTSVGYGDIYATNTTEQVVGTNQTPIKP